MANGIIRPSKLPTRSNPVASEVVPSDDGATVAGVTWENGVNAAVPVASQSEVLAGVNNYKRMTPLTTKQAIDAQVPPKISSAIAALNLGSASQSQASDFATAAQGSLADTAVQPSRTVGTGTGLTGGGNLSANRTLALNPASIASLAKADTSVQTVNGNSPDGAGNVVVDAEFTQEQDSRASAILATFAPTVSWVRTAGYATAVDGGGALYKRALSEPSHAGKFQSADGAWWEMLETEISLQMFGDLSTGATANSAVTDASSYATYSDITSVRVDSDVVVTGLDKSVAADLTFFGTGSISGVFRKEVIPCNAPQPDFGVMDGDLIAGKHLHQLNKSRFPRVVILGDSTFTETFGEPTDKQDTIAMTLRAKLASDFSGEDLDVQNRSIGGAKIGDLLALPSLAPLRAMPWYSGDPNKPWQSYVEDLEPDCIVLGFGQNDGAAFNMASLHTFVQGTKTWDKVPDIVFCTCMSPSLRSTMHDEQEIIGRDSAAGAMRSYARYFGYGFIDFHRALSMARDGFDPRQSALPSAFETVQSELSSGNVYRCVSPRFGGNYKVRFRFNATAWATDSSFFLIAVGSSNGWDHVQLRKGANGNLYWSYTCGDGGATVLIKNWTDTGYPAPTGTLSQLVAEVNDNMFTLYDKEDVPAGRTEPIMSVLLPAKGGAMQPYVYSSATDNRLIDADFWIAEPKLCKTTVTDWAFYADPAYPNGNSINHPTAIAGASVYAPLVQRMKFAGVKNPLVFDSVAAVGTDANLTPKTLFSVDLPGGILTMESSILIEAWGGFGANANNKTVEIKYGPTTIGSITTTQSGGTWSIKSRVKLLMPGTQRAVTEIERTAAPNVPARFAATLDESLPVSVSAVGTNTVASANDVVCSYFRVGIEG